MYCYAAVHGKKTEEFRDVCCEIVWSSHLKDHLTATSQGDVARFQCFNENKLHRTEYTIPYYIQPYCIKVISYNIIQYSTSSYIILYHDKIKYILHMLYCIHVYIILYYQTYIYMYISSAYTIYICYPEVQGKKSEEFRDVCCEIEARMKSCAWKKKVSARKERCWWYNCIMKKIMG